MVDNIPMPKRPAARGGVLVIGIGNPLREDDGAGINVVERLMDRFGEGLNGMVAFQADISLAEKISRCNELIVVDAMIHDGEAGPFSLIDLKPNGSFAPKGGFSSHISDWGTILTIAKEIFGGLPDKCTMVGVRGRSFGISERPSDACIRNSDAAFDFLSGYLTEADMARNARTNHGLHYS